MKTKIQFQDTYLNLTKLRLLEIPLTFWQVIIFFEIELEHECDHEPQLGNLILLLDSIRTPVSSPNLNPSLESTLDPVPIHREI